MTEEVNSSIVVINLINKTDIIGSLIGLQTNGNITIDHPYEISKSYNKDGDYYIYLHPFNEFTSEEIINLDLINVLMVNPPKDVLEKLYTKTLKQHSAHSDILKEEAKEIDKEEVSF